MEIDLIYIFIIGGIALLVTGVAFWLGKSLKRKSYDHEENIAKLEEVRESIERKIYALNDRLIQNEERWLDVNHLLINEIPESYKTFSPIKSEVQYSSFLEVHGIDKNDLLIDPKLAFVLTPFHNDKRTEYVIIRDACFSIGLECKRGDEEYFEGDIFPHVLKQIVKARVIIANINGHNSNVMYELGVAQALNKPVILISIAPDNLPVDIKSQRFVIYQNDEQLKQKLVQELKKII